MFYRITPRVKFLRNISSSTNKREKNKMSNFDIFIYDGSSGHNKNHRCSICNRVSVPDIETNIGEYDSDMSFVRDPKNGDQFICVECDSAIREVTTDYYTEDLEKEESSQKRKQIWNSRF